MELLTMPSGRELTITVAFRLPAPVYRKAMALAARRGVKLSPLLREMVIENLDDAGKRAGEEANDD